MRRFGSFCHIACWWVLPITVHAQAMVSYGAAAAAGSTAGTVAGSKLGKALDGALGSAAGATERAAKQEPAARKKDTKPKSKEPPRPAELIHVSVAPDLGPGFSAVPAIPSATIRPKAEHAAPADVPQPAVTIPAPVVATPEALAAIGSGTTREDLSKLGDPAYKMLLPDDGHLVEVYRYQADGKDVGTVRLRDGVVTAVQVCQP